MKWTPEEDAKLREMYPASTRGEMATALGRTEGMVRSRCWALGLNAKKEPWSSEDDAILRREYARSSVDIKRIARALGRSAQAVASRASNMGLGDYGRPKLASRQGILPLGKFKNKSDLSVHLSAITKKRLATVGHPRGMLGKHHTPEAIAATRAGMRRAWADPEHRLNSKAERQKRSDALTERHRTGDVGKSSATYSRCARGRRPDLGDTFFRSAWEANYARYLNWLKARGEIVSWGYETRTFWFESIRRGTRSYLPDFEVVRFSAKVGVNVTEWHEVKGWMDAKSKTKLARMAKYYPAETVVLIDEKWFQSANRTLAHVIPNWERKQKRAA